MVTLLLECEKGFLDSEEGVPLDNERITCTGEFNPWRMNHREIVREIEKTWQDDQYFHISGQGRSRRVFVYHYSTHQ